MQGKCQESQAQYMPVQLGVRVVLAVEWKSLFYKMSGEMFNSKGEPLKKVYQPTEVMFG